MLIPHIVIVKFAIITNFMKSTFTYLIVAIVSSFVSIGTWEAMHIVFGVDNETKQYVSKK